MISRRKVPGSSIASLIRIFSLLTVLDGTFIEADSTSIGTSALEPTLVASSSLAEVSSLTPVDDVLLTASSNEQTPSPLSSSTASLLVDVVSSSLSSSTLDDPTAQAPQSTIQLDLSSSSVFMPSSQEPTPSRIMTSGTSVVLEFVTSSASVAVLEGTTQTRITLSTPPVLMLMGSSTDGTVPFQTLPLTAAISELTPSQIPPSSTSVLFDSTSRSTSSSTTSETLLQVLPSVTLVQSELSSSALLSSSSVLQETTPSPAPSPSASLVLASLTTSTLNSTLEEVTPIETSSLHTDSPSRAVPMPTSESQEPTPTQASSSTTFLLIDSTSSSLLSPTVEETTLLRVIQSVTSLLPDLTLSSTLQEPTPSQISLSTTSALLGSNSSSVLSLSSPSEEVTPSQPQTLLSSVLVLFTSTSTVDSETTPGLSLSSAASVQQGPSSSVVSGLLSVSQEPTPSQSPSSSTPELLESIGMSASTVEETPSGFSLFTTPVLLGPSNSSILQEPTSSQILPSTVPILLVSSSAVTMDEVTPSPTLSSVTSVQVDSVRSSESPSISEPQEPTPSQVLTSSTSATLESVTTPVLSSTLDETITQNILSATSVELDPLGSSVLISTSQEPTPSQVLVSSTSMLLQESMTSFGTSSLSEETTPLFLPSTSAVLSDSASTFVVLSTSESQEPTLSLFLPPTTSIIVDSGSGSISISPLVETTQTLVLPSTTSILSLVVTSSTLNATTPQTPLSTTPLQPDPSSSFVLMSASREPTPSPILSSSTADLLELVTSPTSTFTSEEITPLQNLVSTTSVSPNPGSPVLTFVSESQEPTPVLSSSTSLLVDSVSSSSSFTVEEPTLVLSSSTSLLVDSVSSFSSFTLDEPTPVLSPSTSLLVDSVSSSSSFTLEEPTPTQSLLSATISPISLPISSVLTDFLSSFEPSSSSQELTPSLTSLSSTSVPLDLASTSASILVPISPSTSSTLLESGSAVEEVTLSQTLVSTTAVQLDSSTSSLLISLSESQESTPSQILSSSTSVLLDVLSTSGLSSLSEEATPLFSPSTTAIVSDSSVVVTVSESQEPTPSEVPLSASSILLDQLSSPASSLSETTPSQIVVSTTSLSSNPSSSSLLSTTLEPSSSQTVGLDESILVDSVDTSVLDSLIEETPSPPSTTALLSESITTSGLSSPTVELTPSQTPLSSIPSQEAEPTQSSIITPVLLGSVSSLVSSPSLDEQTSFTTPVLTSSMPLVSAVSISMMLPDELSTPLDASISISTVELAVVSTPDASATPVLTIIPTTASTVEESPGVASSSQSTFDTPSINPTLLSSTVLPSQSTPEPTSMDLTALSTSPSQPTLVASLADTSSDIVQASLSDPVTSSLDTPPTITPSPSSSGTSSFDQTLSLSVESTLQSTPDVTTMDLTSIVTSTSQLSSEASSSDPILSSSIVSMSQFSTETASTDLTSVIVQPPLSTLEVSPVDPSSPPVLPPLSTTEASPTNPTLSTSVILTQQSTLTLPLLTSFSTPLTQSTPSASTMDIMSSVSSQAQPPSVIASPTTPSPSLAATSLATPSPTLTPSPSPGVDDLVTMEIIANDTTLQQLQMPSAERINLEDNIAFLYEEGLRILAARQRRQTAAVNSKAIIVEAVRSSDSIVQVNFYVTDLRTNTVVLRDEVIAALNAVPNSRLDEVTGYNVLQVFAYQVPQATTDSPVDLAVVIPVTVVGVVLILGVVIVVVALFAKWRAHARRRWIVTPSPSSFGSHIDLNEEIDTKSIGIQHGTPVIGGRSRVTIADLAVAGYRKPAQPIEYPRTDHREYIPYYNVRTGHTPNTTQTHSQSPAVEVNTQSHLEVCRHGTPTALQPKFLPLTALVSVPNGETGSQEVVSGGKGRQEVVGQDLQQAAKSPKLSGSRTSSTVERNQPGMNVVDGGRQPPIEPQVQVIQHGMSVREQELERETERLTSENIELKKAMNYLKDELEDQKHFSMIKQRNLEHIQKLAYTPDEAPEKKTRRVRPSTQLWASPEEKQAALGRAMEKAEKRARRAWSEQPSLSADREISPPKHLRGLPSLQKSSLMSKNAWEEPVVEFGTSHVSAGYTTEKDSMTSVVPQAKPKKKRHPRAKRNRIAPAELEFSGPIAKHVQSSVKSEFAMMDSGGGNVQLVRVWPVQPVSPMYVPPSPHPHPSAVGHVRHIPPHMTPPQVQSMPTRPSQGNSLFYPYP